MDREWYSLDDGFDAEMNQPFGDVSEEYTQQKEEQLEQKKKKRMSAKQKQIQKDNELWERNRMLTSGVVTSIDHDSDYEEESEARVHLLVHNIIPPFLDGRYVFTKQPEAVVPVRVSKLFGFSVCSSIHFIRTTLGSYLRLGSCCPERISPRKTLQRAKGTHKSAKETLGIGGNKDW